MHSHKPPLIGVISVSSGLGHIFFTFFFFFWTDYQGRIRTLRWEVLPDLYTHYSPFKTFKMFSVSIKINTYVPHLHRMPNVLRHQRKFKSPRISFRSTQPPISPNNQPHQVYHHCWTPQCDLNCYYFTRVLSCIYFCF